MLSKIYSAAFFGLETTLIEVEVDVSNGLHSFNIIGLPDISIKKAIDKYSLSARSYHRILKISRTIADLENTKTIKFNHVAEALQYKTEFSWNEYQ